MAMVEVQIKRMLMTVAKNYAKPRPGGQERLLKITYH
jgi:hypothetical protein